MLYDIIEGRVSYVVVFIAEGIKHGSKNQAAEGELS